MNSYQCSPVKPFLTKLVVLIVMVFACQNTVHADDSNMNFTSRNKLDLSFSSCSQFNQLLGNLSNESVSFRLLNCSQKRVSDHAGLIAGFQNIGHVVLSVATAGIYAAARSEDGPEEFFNHDESEVSYETKPAKLKVGLRRDDSGFHAASIVKYDHAEWCAADAGSLQSADFGNDLSVIAKCEPQGNVIELVVKVLK